MGPCERRQTSVGIKSLGDEGRPGDGSLGLSVVSTYGWEMS